MISKKKKIVVLVEDGPFNTVRSSEAFRMSIGLTLAENEVCIVLVGDGVFHLNKLRGANIGRPSIYDVMGVFEQIDLKLYADAEAMLARKIEAPPEMTRELPSPDVMLLIREADVVLPFR